MKNVVRPEHAVYKEDCWACKDEAEAVRLVQWLRDAFHVVASVCSVTDCDDLKD